MIGCPPLSIPDIKMLPQNAVITLLQLLGAAIILVLATVSYQLVLAF